MPAFAARAWFVDNAAKGGDGNAIAPFASLADAEKASGAGDVIIVLAGVSPYAGGITLKDQQSLIGQSGDVRAALKRAAIESVTPPPSGTRPVLLVGDSHAISIAGSAYVDGVAISGAGAGAAVRIDEGRGDVSLVRVAIERTDGPAVLMHKHEGAVTFGSGTTIKVRAATTDAIAIRDSRSTVTFAEPLDITTSGARALVVEKTTKLVIASGSTLQSTDAAVLELRDVELDASFASLSASAADAGVTLARTRGRFSVSGGTIRGARRRALDIRGASNVTLRGLVLTGTGNGVADQDCSADLLVHDNVKCSAALILQDAENVVVEDVRVEGSGQVGISGRDVRKAAFRRITINGAGDELSEHAFVFRNLLGEVAFSGCTVTRSASRGLYILNDLGTSTISIDDCRFTESAQPLGQQGVLIAAEDTATMNVRVRRSTFTKLASTALHISADGSSTVDVAVSGNTFERTGGAVNLVSDERATVKFDIAGNRVSGSTVNAINVALSSNASTSTMSGTIVRNVVGANAASACRACSGISIRSGGTGTVSVNIHGNDIGQVGGSGIWAQTLGQSRLDVAIAANTLHDPIGSEASAIRVQAGAVGADRSAVCARIGGSDTLANKISGAWDQRGAIQFVNRTASVLRLSGPASAEDDAVRIWIRRHNGGASLRILRPTPPRADAIMAGYECSVPPVR